MNNIILGKIGESRKIWIFKEADFKEEFAPENANIEKLVIHGDTFVIMSY